MSDDTDFPGDHDFMTLKTKMKPGQEAPVPLPREGRVPILGIFAVGFSLLGILVMAPLFAPLGLILGIVALFMGQVALGLIAIFLAVIAVITSPIFLAILGLSVFMAGLGF